MDTSNDGIVHRKELEKFLTDWASSEAPAHTEDSELDNFISLAQRSIGIHPEDREDHLCKEDVFELVSQNDFCKSLRSSTALRLFDFIDKDRKGTIDAKALFKFAKPICPSMKLHEMEQLIVSFKSVSPGVLQRDEFQCFFLAGFFDLDPEAMS